MLIVLAILLTAAGAATVYVTAGNQSMLPQRAGATARRAGWVVILLSLCFWVAELGAGAGVFGAFVTLMLSWIALPWLALLPVFKTVTGAR
ncbi:hypothetical protein [Silvimonas iriomotensis]|uniref:Uncharacterized protein n=1 Tax=Silvimonas iriomotensis TaxID=449662 RepID=A0ABQ2P5G4_9NEIS|nr:hypothetical protein [Silvimonas iriomotensis]GGP18310.1 hypothetical protein GCM10010970_04290 [Silvimonas iriomotensis]